MTVSSYRKIYHNNGRWNSINLNNKCYILQSSHKKQHTETIYPGTTKKRWPPKRTRRTLQILPPPPTSRTLPGSGRPVLVRPVARLTLCMSQIQECPFPPGIWHEVSPGWAGIWHLFRSQYPGHLTPWKKRRNTLCIPIIWININRDNSVKGCFQFYFVTTWAQWSIENKNKY